MIKLTYEQIRHEGFNEAMRKVLTSKMPVPVSRRVIAIVDEIKKEQAQSDKLFEVLSGQYLEPMPESKGKLLQVKKDLPEDEKKAGEQKIEEFLKTPVEIQKEPLKDSELQFLILTPAELMAINGVVAND